MIKKSDISIGILGAGRVIQNRCLEVFRDELKGAKVKYVCDQNKECTDKVAAQLLAKSIYDKEEMLRKQDIDAIYVATESGKHYSHSMDALRANKHVIVEKPPALFPQEMLSCEEYAKSRGLMYAVIFQNRLNPAIQILKKTYARERFGKIVLATIRLRWCRYQNYYDDGWHGSWSMDGGVINQQAIHHLDALQWICGSIKEVFAMQSNALNQLEAEDTTVATVKFENGGLGVIEATTAARPRDFEASISIVGEKGTVVVGGIALNKIESWQFIDETAEDKEIPKQYSQDVPTGYGLSHGPLIQEIIHRLREGNIEAPISASDCVATVRLVHALYRSAELERPVLLKDNPLSTRLGQQSITMAAQVNK